MWKQGTVYNAWPWAGSIWNFLSEDATQTTMEKQSSCCCKNSSPGWLKKVLMSLTLSHKGMNTKKLGVLSSFNEPLAPWVFVKKKEDPLPSHMVFITTPHWLWVLAWLVSKAGCCKSSHATWPVNQKCHWLMGQWAHTVCCKLNLGLQSFSIAIVSYVSIVMVWSCKPWSSGKFWRSSRGCW